MLKWTSYECNFELAELRARSQGWPSHFGRRRALMNFAPKDTSGKLNESKLHAQLLVEAGKNVDCCWLCVVSLFTWADS